MLRIFIGFDHAETVAFHVLAHSILKRSSIPVAIVPLNRHSLAGLYMRERGPLESTDFSLSRFLVPYLCAHRGTAVFMDCDMLCLGDVAELASYGHDMHEYAVRVVQHEYIPARRRKFLGAKQTRYEKKNWSSVMVFNNALCDDLTLEAVNTRSGLWLHQFKWTKERQIGALPPEWNYLVGEERQTKRRPTLIHYTNGTPCFPEYADCEYADLWRAERDSMLSYLC